MKLCKMKLAGYQHLSCDRKTHTHRLLNLQTNQIEIWVSVGQDRIGISYKNTKLAFFSFEHDQIGRDDGRNEIRETYRSCITR